MSDHPASSSHAGLEQRTSHMAEHHWVRSGDCQLAVSVDLPDPARFPGPTPVVMLVHGFSSHRIGRSYVFVELGNRLIEEGIALVRFDQAGCGESTGSQLDYSLLTMMRDCETIAKWIREDQDRFDPKRFALLGSSMGSLGAVAVDGSLSSSGAVSAGIALWAPVYDLEELVAGKVDRSEINYALKTLGYVPYRGLTLAQPFFDHLDALNPVEATMRKGKSPLLIVHALEDEVVGMDHGRRFAEVCEQIQRPCEFVELRSTSHDFHDFPCRSDCIRITVAALRKWLIDPFVRS